MGSYGFLTGSVTRVTGVGDGFGVKKIVVDWVVYIGIGGSLVVMSDVTSTFVTRTAAKKAAAPSCTARARNMLIIKSISATWVGRRKRGASLVKRSGRVPSTR